MFYVYRFVAGSCEDQTIEIGEAATRLEARDLAMREGGDQIQEGRDGEVENIDRGLWSASVRRRIETEESSIFP